LKFADVLVLNAEGEENAEKRKGGGMNVLQEATAEDYKKLTEIIIGAALDVHRALGPGLLESAYEACLAHELEQRGLRVEEQKALPLRYQDIRLDCGYRVDLLVDERVIVEIKVLEATKPVHKAQLLSYLRLSGGKVGLLINFNVEVLTQGVSRVVNQLPERNTCVELCSFSLRTVRSLR
jgi:GxxExxY protein